MEHDFWLLQEKTIAYTEYSAYLPRQDAPAGFSNDFVCYIADTLAWVPTCNPAWKNCPAGVGLNMFGPTIINQVGGYSFQQVCLSWARLLDLGPETLHLRGLFSEELSTYQPLLVEKKSCIQTLTLLAHFGEMAATVKYFILHLGV